MALVDLDKFLDEVLDGGLIGLPATLAAHHSHRPALQRRAVWEEELLALEIPTSRCPRSSNTCAVLDLWRGEEAPLDDGPSLADLKPVLLEGLVGVPGQHAEAMLDCLPSLVGRSHGEFDPETELVRAK